MEEALTTDANVTEPVQIGLVGAGNRGRNHAARYDRIPGAEIAAVADVDEPKAQALAEEYSAESYPTHAEMLDAAELDAVNVCVHATLHADIAVDALEAGVHVFCEKPMADSYANARRMADAADRTGNRLAVQNQLLYTKDARAAKALADAGELGEIYHGLAARSPGFAFAGDGNPEEVRLGARRRGTPYVDGYGSPAFVREDAAGGGVVLDLGSYTIGQLLYLMDSPDSDPSAGPPTVERVRGETFQTVPERVAAAADSEYAERLEESGYDVEDVATAFVTFEDGSVLTVRTSWSRYLDASRAPWSALRAGSASTPSSTSRRSATWRCERVRTSKSTSSASSTSTASAASRRTRRISGPTRSTTGSNR